MERERSRVGKFISWNPLESMFKASLKSQINLFSFLSCFSNERLGASHRCVQCEGVICEVGTSVSPCQSEVSHLARHGRTCPRPPPSVPK